MRFLIALFLPLSLLAQPAAPVIEFQKSLNLGPATSFEGVCQTTDGGYLLVGKYTPSGAKSEDGVLLKLDYQGNKEWEKKVEGPQSDDLRQVKEVPGKGYIVMGTTQNQGAGKRDVLLFMIDAQGNEQWRKTFGGPESDAGYHLAVTDGGDFLVAGYTQSFSQTSDESTGWLLKVDSWGNQVWQLTVDDGPLMRYYSVVKAPAGESWAVGFQDQTHNAILAHVDANGTRKRKLVMREEGVVDGTDLQLTEDGKILMAGNKKKDEKAESKAFVRFLHPDHLLGGRGEPFKTLWTYEHPTPASSFIRIVPYGSGYVVAGWEKNSPSLGNDAYLQYLGADGRPAWNKRIGANQNDEFNDVLVCRDGGLMVVGRMGNDGLLVKFKGDAALAVKNPVQPSTGSSSSNTGSIAHKGTGQTSSGAEDIDFSAPKTGKNYLVIMAIDNYQHWSPLSNAVKDAKDVKQVLTTQYQFEPSDVMELYNEQVTKEGMIGLMTEVAKKVTPNDNVLIYYSGHGHYDALIEEGYWVTVESRKGEGMIADMLPNSTLSKYIKAIKSRHTFLVADACFSGALFASNSRGYVDNVEQIPSRWGLTSGTLEYVSDGAKGGNSPFCTYFLKYLLTNSKPKAPVSDLVQYVKVAVANNAGQTPVGAPLKNVGDEGGEFIFYRR